VYSYNLADGGATTDAELIAPWSPTVLSFIDQTTKFSNNLASKPSYAPWTSDNTLVGVWMGVNDVGNAFYLNGWEALITKVLGRYFEQLQIMYNAGVRKFVLLGVPRKFNCLLSIHLLPTRIKVLGVTSNGLV
jgi:hypothetical protein